MTTKTQKKTPRATERPVLVTTAHRGVFFGYAAGRTDGEVVTLQRARNCVYWSADVRGFVGLAANGPSATCRVGPAATMTLRDVTAVLDVTPDAVVRWEAEPWQK